MPRQEAFNKIPKSYILVSPFSGGEAEKAAIDPSDDFINEWSAPAKSKALNGIGSVWPDSRQGEQASMLARDLASVRVLKQAA